MFKIDMKQEWYHSREDGNYSDRRDIFPDACCVISSPCKRHSCPSRAQHPSDRFQRSSTRIHAVYTSSKSFFMSVPAVSMV